MFIIDHCCISPQGSFEKALLTNQMNEVVNKKLLVLESDYKNLIPNNVLRRMEKDMRLAVVQRFHYQKDMMI